jgi:hypothetical protein
VVSFFKKRAYPWALVKKGLEGFKRPRGGPIFHENRSVFSRNLTDKFQKKYGNNKERI